MVSWPGQKWAGYKPNTQANSELLWHSRVRLPYRKEEGGLWQEREWVCVWTWTGHVLWRCEEIRAQNRKSFIHRRQVSAQTALNMLCTAGLRPIGKHTCQNTQVILRVLKHTSSNRKPCALTHWHQECKWAQGWGYTLNTSHSKLKPRQCHIRSFFECWQDTARRKFLS